MKTQFSFTTSSNGNFVLRGPYSPANNEKYRAVGGRFDRKLEAWIFPPTAATRSMIEKQFGSESPLVRVLVPADVGYVYGKQELIGGYVLATRKSRDSVPYSPPDVRVESGSWSPSGGTSWNPVVNRKIPISLVVRRAFALAHQLEIIAEGAVSESAPRTDQVPIQSLKDISDTDLLAEITRRGLVPQTGGEHV